MAPSLDSCSPTVVVRSIKHSKEKGLTVLYHLSNKLANGYYESFETLTDEQSRQELRDAWATPIQQLYNLMHKTCPDCNGQGYQITRIRQVVVRDNVGCYECKGTGAVLK